MSRPSPQRSSSRHSITGLEISAISQESAALSRSWSPWPHRSTGICPPPSNRCAIPCAFLAPRAWTYVRMAGGPMSRPCSSSVCPCQSRWVPSRASDTGGPVTTETPCARGRRRSCAGGAMPEWSYASRETNPDSGRHRRCLTRFTRPSGRSRAPTMDSRCPGTCPDFLGLGNESGSAAGASMRSGTSALRSARFACHRCSRAARPPALNFHPIDG